MHGRAGELEVEEPELVLVLDMVGSASTGRPTTLEGDRPGQGESGEGDVPEGGGSPRE